MNFLSLPGFDAEFLLPSRPSSALSLARRTAPDADPSPLRGTQTAESAAWGEGADSA